MKKYVLLVSVLFLALGLGSVHAANDTVVIGLQGPITGAWAYEGQMAKQSCEIAADLINKKGGILGGKKIVLKVEDDAGEPKSGALAAQKLVAQKDVVAVVSTYGSSVCEPASNVYEKFKKVNIGYGVTAVRLTSATSNTSSAPAAGTTHRASSSRISCRRNSMQNASRSCTITPLSGKGLPKTRGRRSSP